MSAHLSALAGPALFPFSLAAAVMAGLVLVEMLSLLAGHSASALVDGALGQDGALDNAVDAPAGPGEAHGAFSPAALMSWLNVGRVPFLILLFLYFGYIALSNASDEKTSVSKATAIFGLIGAINVPIINRSVVWWNSLHQGPSITVKGSSISSEILWPLAFTTLGFSLMFGAIVLMRMRAVLASAKVEARLRRLATA